MSASAGRKSKRKASEAPAPVRKIRSVRTPEPDPVPETAPDDESSAEAGPAEAAADNPVSRTGEHPVPQGGSEAPPDGQPPAELDRERVKSVLESLVFVSESTVTAVQLARVIKVKTAIVRELMAELIAEYEPRGVALVEVGSGYQFRSAARNAEAVRDFVAQRPVRLTRAQLETLALVAYRQPITRPEIDEVRGVDSGSAMGVLLERELIKMLGRKDEPGRPLLYGTTPYFLEFVGMRSLKELPTLREFTELSEENRALFKRKTGEEVGDAEAALLAAEESARHDDEPLAHISDEDLAELAAQADAEEATLGGPSEAPDGPSDGGEPEL